MQLKLDELFKPKLMDAAASARRSFQCILFVDSNQAITAIEKLVSASQGLRILSLQENTPEAIGELVATAVCTILQSVHDNIPINLISHGESAAVEYLVIEELRRIQASLNSKTSNLTMRAILQASQSIYIRRGFDLIIKQSGKETQENRMNLAAALQQHSVRPSLFQLLLRASYLADNDKTFMLSEMIPQFQSYSDDLFSILGELEEQGPEPDNVIQLMKYECGVLADFHIWQLELQLVKLSQDLVELSNTIEQLYDMSQKNEFDEETAEGVEGVRLMEDLTDLYNLVELHSIQHPLLDGKHRIIQNRLIDHAGLLLCILGLIPDFALSEPAKDADFYQLAVNNGSRLMPYNFSMKAQLYSHSAALAAHSTEKIWLLRALNKQKGVVVAIRRQQMQTPELYELYKEIEAQDKKINQLSQQNISFENIICNLQLAHSIQVETIDNMLVYDANREGELNKVIDEKRLLIENVNQLKLEMGQMTEDKLILDTDNDQLHKNQVLLEQQLATSQELLSTDHLQKTIHNPRPLSLAPTHTNLGQVIQLSRDTDDLIARLQLKIIERERTIEQLITDLNTPYLSQLVSVTKTYQDHLLKEAQYYAPKGRGDLTNVTSRYKIPLPNLTLSDYNTKDNDFAKYELIKLKYDETVKLYNTLIDPESKTVRARLENFNQVLTLAKSRLNNHRHTGFFIFAKLVADILLTALAVCSIVGIPLLVYAANRNTFLSDSHGSAFTKHSQDIINSGASQEGCGA